MLSQLHAHSRDSFIIFKEEGHEYTLIGIDTKPTSVTTLIHKYFTKFDNDRVITKMMASTKWKDSKYFGMTSEQIKQQWKDKSNEAAEAGTFMHKSIENYLNNIVVVNDTVEYQMFLHFWANVQQYYLNWEIYRTEWLIYDNSGKVSGSIDCVLRNKIDPKYIMILDWKRSKEIKVSNHFDKGTGPFANLDDCNFVHYSLQLNIYRHILETCYDKKVTYMMLIVMHPDNKDYQCVSIERMAIDTIWSALTV